MLRLAINAVSLAPGGGLNGLLGYLQAWRELGAALRITVYASRQKVLDDVRAARPDVRVEPFAVGAGSARHFILQQRTLGRVIEASGADVIMTTQSAVGRCRIPQLVHHRNLKRFKHQGVWRRLRTLAFDETLKDLAARRALRTCACNVFISDYLRREAEKIAPDSAPRNHVVHNGLNREIIEAAGHTGEQWDGRPQILAITSPAEHKDNPTLLRTLARLRQREPQVDWRVWLAGTGNWSSVKQEAARLGILDRVEFLGYLNHGQMEPFARRAACLVFTSVLEGFGNPPLEAMARRCPVVACNCTAIPEVVGDAGILVEPGNDEQFADAIVRLRTDRGLRDALIARGLERIQRFTWTNSASAMQRLLAQCADAGALQPEAGPATRRAEGKT